MRKGGMSSMGVATTREGVSDGPAVAGGVNSRRAGRPPERSPESISELNLDASEGAHDRARAPASQPDAKHERGIFRARGHRTSSQKEGGAVV